MCINVDAASLILLLDLLCSLFFLAVNFFYMDTIFFHSTEETCICKRAITKVTHGTLSYRSKHVVWQVHLCQPLNL